MGLSSQARTAAHEAVALCLSAAPFPAAVTNTDAGAGFISCDAQNEPVTPVHLVNGGGTAVPAIGAHGAPGKVVV